LNGNDTSAWWLALLAALAVGAWVGRWWGRRQRAPLSRDYLLGLEHLLHDRLDAAARALSAVAVHDDDALELQFALGSLFRKRGEVDRATQLHQRLSRHEIAGVRSRAQFELALDYLAAGLMDRAEQSLQQIATAEPYREAALLHLQRLYETQSEWANALKVFHSLPTNARAERRAVAAHYLCELAEHALLQGDVAHASRLTGEAEGYGGAAARIACLRARLAERRGDHVVALTQYRHALQLQPSLGGELQARIAALQPQSAVPAPQGSGAPQGFGQYHCEDCGLESQHWHWRCPRCCGWDRLIPRQF
jgi:lipopolysaccharide biosynthesis regulator YciM